MPAGFFLCSISHLFVFAFLDSQMRMLHVVLLIDVMPDTMLVIFVREDCIQREAMKEGTAALSPAANRGRRLCRVC